MLVVMHERVVHTNERRVLLLLIEVGRRIVVPKRHRRAVGHARWPCVLPRQLLRLRMIRLLSRVCRWMVPVTVGRYHPLRILMRGVEVGLLPRHPCVCSGSRHGCRALRDGHGCRTLRNSRRCGALKDGRRCGAMKSMGD